MKCVCVYVCVFDSFSYNDTVSWSTITKYIRLDSLQVTEINFSYI
jgi:hypothetical protein